MRKPELEPVIKTDTDTDTTADIPADSGDSAPSGGGPAVSDTTQDPLEEVEADFLPQDAGGSGPQGKVQLTEGAGGGAVEGSSGGGAGEAPEPQEEEPEESSSPMEDLTETVQEYLQELDPQQVSDTMQSLLADLQQGDYSFLSDLPDAKLTPEQANQAVHDLLTELQKVDYRALTEELHTVTDGDIRGVVTEFHDSLSLGFADIEPVEATVVEDGPGTWLKAIGIWLINPDNTFQLVEHGFTGWDLLKYEHLLPNIFTNDLLDSIGLNDLTDSLFRSIPGAVKDGKETWLSSLARNLTKFLIGKMIGDKISKIFRSVIRDLGVNPYEFSLRNMGTRAFIETRKQIAIFRAEHKRDEEIEAANAEVQQAKDEKQAALDAYDTEKNELDAAENTRQQSIQQAEAQESQALAENERIRNETIQKNNAAAEEAKTQIQNDQRPTAFQNDVDYQAQLRSSGLQCRQEVENAQNINRSEVDTLERQKNEALQTQQSNDFTALNREKQSGSISAEDAQARQSAIERMEGQSYDNIRSQYNSQIHDSNTRCAQACEEANQRRQTRDLQATDDARDRANQKAEVKKTLDDQYATSRANNTKADAESTYRDQCRAAHDKRAQADPVYHSCSSRQEIESRADANITQKQTAASTRIADARQTCDRECTQAETTAQRSHQRLDDKLERLDAEDRGASVAPVPAAGTTAPSQSAAHAAAPVPAAGATAPSQSAAHAAAPVPAAGTTAPSQSAAHTAPVPAAGTTAPSQSAAHTAPVPSQGSTAPNQQSHIAPVPDSQSTGTTQINAPTHGPTGIVH